MLPTHKTLPPPPKKHLEPAKALVCLRLLSVSLPSLLQVRAHCRVVVGGGLDLGKRKGGDGRGMQRPRARRVIVVRSDQALSTKAPGTQLQVLLLIIMQS